MSEVISAIKQICEEKNLSYEAVISTIESALAAAYRKDYGEKNQNIKVEFDPETMTTKVYDAKTVVEDLPEEQILDIGSSESGISDDKKEKEKGGEEIEKGDEVKKEENKILRSAQDDNEEEIRRFNSRTEIQLSDAKQISKKYKLGDEIKIELPTKDDYGRMAAQTAKQVIIQRLREAERDMVFAEFKNKEHEVITGVVQRVEGRVVLVDLGKATGIILPEDQIRTERYRSSDRLKVYVREVRISSKGPEILLSRTADEILKKVFYLEIPEISNGLIDIKAVAREAGSRAKVAVAANSDNIDPIGSCVGQRGARIQTIISELGGEKIDIIEYNDDLEEFIANALAPAKIVSVELNQQEHKANVKVAADQLSLAIGKNGQNVRLAAKLSNWKIDITEAESGEVVKLEEESPIETTEAVNSEEAEQTEETKQIAEKANEVAQPTEETV